MHLQTMIMTDFPTLPTLSYFSTSEIPTLFCRPLQGVQTPPTRPCPGYPSLTIIVREG